VRIVDFRARPNTNEFMGIYSKELGRDPWAKFQTVRPPTVEVDEYLTMLAAEGIEHSVFIGRQGVLAGPKFIPNDFVLEVAERSGGSIYPFAGVSAVDTSEAISEMDRCAAAGTRGFAFDPPSPMGYGAGETWDGPSMVPLLEHASRLDLPVVLTTGPIVGMHGRPEPIDRIASDLPNLTIICSHGIWPRTQDMIALAFRRPNVVLETSIYLTYPGAGPLLAEAASTLIPDQIVYASAFPFLPIDSHTHVSELAIPNEIRSKILFENAARILDIKG
jgi:predicted TIM-barrel fold metal-dependent hydrolase